MVFTDLRRLFRTGLLSDWKLAVLIIGNTLLLLVDYYEKITPWKYLDRFILHFAIPVLIILFVFKEKPKGYGLVPGDWRAGLLICAASAAVFFPILWLAARLDGSILAYYLPLYHHGLGWQMFIEMVGWEFQFRGWYYFGLERRFGNSALWLQAVPFAIIHAGKPALETYSTIFGGFFFGWVAWRTRPYFYPLIIHWMIATGITWMSYLIGGL